MRASPRLPGGLWNDGAGACLERIVDFVHTNTTAKIAMQLGHAGAKGSTQRDALGGRTCRSRLANWPLLSASPQQYLDGVSAWSRR